MFPIVIGMGNDLYSIKYFTKIYIFMAICHFLLYNKLDNYTKENVYGRIPYFS